MTAPTGLLSLRKFHLRQRRPQHPGANLGKGRVSRRGGIVAERREPAVIGRAQLLDRNISGRLQNAMYTLMNVDLLIQ